MKDQMVVATSIVIRAVMFYAALQWLGLAAALCFGLSVLVNAICDAGRGS